MVIYTRFSKGATVYSDTKNTRVTITSSEFNSTATWSTEFDNFNGIYDNEFNVGEQIVIKAQTDVNPPTTTLITGKIRNIRYTGSPNDERLVLEGVDYGTAQLMDNLVEPEVYNNKEVSLIIIDIFDKYVTGGLTRTNVTTTTTTLTNIRISNTSVYDAFKQLAELAGFIFWVDTANDLHFILQESADSGLTFNNTNVTIAQFRTSMDELYNDIWVYGGTYLTAVQQSFVADGAGSVFTLTYHPSNTTVTSSGTIVTGGVFEMINIPGATDKYLVDYDQMKIIMTSGTDAGNNIPTSGSAVVVDYYRKAPIVKQGTDDSSVTAYGKRSKVITDKNIDDPKMAVSILQSQIEIHKDPKSEGTLKIKDVLIVTPGQKCIVDLPYHNIKNDIQTIISATYSFEQSTIYTGTPLTIKTSTKLKDITDTLKQVLIDIKKLQAADISSSDVITRLKTSTGSFGLTCSYWQVADRMIGSDFILGHPVNGRLGVVASGVQPYLAGSHVLAYTIQYSGGE